MKSIKNNKFEKDYLRSINVKFDFIVQFFNDRILNRRVYKEIILKFNEIMKFIIL